MKHPHVVIEIFSEVKQKISVIVRSILEKSKVRHGKCMKRRGKFAGNVDAGNRRDQTRDKPCPSASTSNPWALSFSLN